MKKFLALSALILCPLVSFAQSGGAASLRHGTQAERPATCRTSRGEVYIQTDGAAGLYVCEGNAWVKASGSAHAHAIADVANLQTQLDAKAAQASLDAEAAARVAGDASTLSAANSYTDAGLASNAAADRARANHTGTQTLSTISDAGTAAALNAPASGNAAAGEVVKGNDTRLTDSRTPLSHNHAAAEITSGVLASARGGTNSAFFSVAGPTAARTYTLPDSNQTLGALGVAQTWSASQTFSSAIKAPNGQYNAPGYTFTNNAGSGMVLDSDNASVFFSTNGGVRLYLQSDKIRVLNQIAFSVDPGSTNGTSGLSIFEAGIAKFTNGTTGNGTFKIGDPGTKPACDSTRRGMFWIDEGATGVKDTVEVCAKDAANAYAWRTLY